MNEAVDRVLLERAQLDAGFPQSLGVSAVVHGLILVGALVAPLLFPAGPVLKVADGVMIALPPGGGGQPGPPQNAAPAAPAPPATTPPAPEAPPPDIKKIVKPPKEEPRQGLPELDTRSKKRKDRERKTARSSEPSRTATPMAVGGTATASQTPGLSFAPVGPGVPGGMDPNGDWYLASVQRKIWLLWSQQLSASAYPTLMVSFTILADGSVSDIRVVQSSGIYALDTAAQRAIATAAPFSPLPKAYGTNAFTLKAVFKPEN